MVGQHVQQQRITTSTASVDIDTLNTASGTIVEKVVADRTGLFERRQNNLAEGHQLTEQDEER